MIAISLSTQTLYADLAQRVATDPASGSVYTRSVAGADYLYAKIRAGTERIDEYIGRADDPIARARANDYEHGTRLAAERRQTIAMLRRAGLPTPARPLGTLVSALRHMDLFDRGVVLVGTAAYLLSAPLVGQILPAQTIMTGDADLATATLSLSAKDDAPLLDVLRLADPSFEAILPLDGWEPPSKFRTSAGYLVDVITPIRTRDDRNPLRLPQLQAGAAPLQYLAWLIADSVPVIALWGSGVTVRVPQPARYAIHKLIVAQARLPGSRDKRGKDLAQAAALIAALKLADPFALEDALVDARAREAGVGGADRSIVEGVGRCDLRRVVCRAEGRRRAFRQSP